MWLDSLIIEIQNLEIDKDMAKWETELYEKINSEHLEFGRDFLFKKYNHNLTYVYKLLNSDILQKSRDHYQFIKHQYDHKLRCMDLIRLFHEDGDIISPRYYVSEEERLWKETKMGTSRSQLKNHPLG